MVHQVKMSFKEKLFCLMSEKQYLKITRKVLANQKRAAGVDVMSEGVSVKLPRKKNISRNSSAYCVHSQSLLRKCTDNNLQGKLQQL